jgi:quercetin dioxygenase-like cupin family protein
MLPDTEIARDSSIAKIQVGRLAEQVDVDFGPLSTYRKLLGGAPLPIFTGVQTCAPGYVTGLHSHPYTELLFVIEGSAYCFLAGHENERTRLAAGDIVALPPNVAHAFGNDSDKTLRILGIHTAAERVVNFADGSLTGEHGYPTK